MAPESECENIFSSNFKNLNVFFVRQMQLSYKLRELTDTIKDMKAGQQLLHDAVMKLKDSRPILDDDDDDDSSEDSEEEDARRLAALSLQVPPTTFEAMTFEPGLLDKAKNLVAVMVRIDQFII